MSISVVDGGCWDRAEADVWEAEDAANGADEEADDAAEGEACDANDAPEELTTDADSDEGADDEDDSANRLSGS